MTLPDVKSPIAAVSAARLSIFAVPSIYKSFHSNPEAPISLVPSASGKIFPVNVAPAPTISPPLIVPTPATARLPFANMVAAAPTISPPLAVTIPAAAILPALVIVAPVLTLIGTPANSLVPSKVKLALSSSSPPVPAITTRLSVRSPIKAVSADNESIFAVPSRNRSPHSLVAAPMFLVPSASGIKLLPTDVKVETPETLKFPSPVVLTPETVKLPNTLAPTPRVSKRFR